ncbi:MAG TPA: CBS domain-containing protein [Alphaproteobacteria bacterium]|nr:CBS domain-containing protein [Alphaproteobacteria bacterium]
MKYRTVSELVRDQVLAQLSPEASVRAAVRLMAARGVGAVVVTNEGRLAGIFTERDMLNRVAAEGRDPDSTKLCDVMTRNPRTIEDNARTIEALRAMQRGGFRHLPVTRRGKLAGILSLRDFASVELAEIEREGDFERAIAEGGAPHD